MMIYLRCVFYIILSFFYCSFALCEELTGATREENLTNAVRNDYNFLDGTSFIIKKLEFNGSLGYFCGAAKYKDDGFVKKDGYIMVFDAIMELDKDKKWEQKRSFNSFSFHSDFACHLKGGLSEYLSKNEDATNYCVNVSKFNPERKKILDVIRRGSDDKFIVKKICSTNKFAYFCGVRMGSDGYLERTGKAIDVYDVVLKKSEKTWRQVVDIGQFGNTINEVKCHFGREDVVLSEIIIKNVVSVFDSEEE